MEKKDLKNLRTMYALTLILVPTILMAISAQYLDGYVRTITEAIILFLQAIVVHGMFLNKKD